MQIGHLKSANVALENDVLTQLNNVNEHIKYLESQIQDLQQRNTQLAGEHNQTRVFAMQTQNNLELQIQHHEHPRF
jgi:prefoldin subunit 5